MCTLDSTPKVTLLNLPDAPPDDINYIFVLPAFQSYQNYWTVLGIVGGIPLSPVSPLNPIPISFAVIFLREDMEWNGK